MSVGHIDTRELKALLIARIEALAAELVPDGKRAASYWIGRCPWRADRNTGSFWINLRGKAPGTFKDAATDEKGDVLTLIAKCMGTDFVGAKRWAAGWLGLADIPDAERKRAVVAMAAGQADAERRAADILADNRRRALAWWLKLEPISGSRGETYLREARGIDIGRLPRPPQALRFCALARHAETGTRWPAIVSCMTGSDGKLWATHTIYLAADGSGKAPVTPVRRIWPSFSGSAIRLSRGIHGVAPEVAERRGLVDDLILCEGVEDGLSLALAAPAARVWATGALGNLAHIRLPACCAGVTVAADNDWGKPQAAKLLQKGIEALVAQRRPGGLVLKVARSPIGKDANDALRGSVGAQA